MARPIGGQDIGKQLCAALGLEGKQVRCLEFRFAVDEAVTVQVKFFASKEDAEALLDTVKRYRLITSPAPEEVAPAP